MGADMSKRVRLAISLIAVVFSTPLAAKRGEILSSLNDQRYTEVRNKLISIGYEPARVRNRDISDNCPGLSSCSAYPEVANCSGIGLALCESAFFNRGTGQYIKVVTYGETAKRVDGIYHATLLDLRDWGLKVR